MLLVRDLFEINPKPNIKNHGKGTVIWNASSHVNTRHALFTKKKKKKLHAIAFGFWDDFSLHGN